MTSASKRGVGSKIGQSCQWMVEKTADMEGRKSEKIADVVYGWSQGSVTHSLNEPL